MRQGRLVAIALLFVVLVTTAQPAAAADAGLVYASQTDTGAELSAGELTKMQINDDAARLIGQHGTTATADPDETTGIFSSDRGVTIEPNTDIAGVEVDLSADQPTGVTVALKKTDGSVLERTTASSTTVEFTAELQAGTQYFVVVEADSDTIGYDNDPAYQYTSADVDIVSGARDGATESGFRYAFSSVTAIEYTDNGTGGSYAGANHTADRVAEGVVDLNISGTSATVEWQGWNGSSWTTLTSDSYSSSGIKTADLSAAYDKYRTNVTFAGSSGATGAVISEGIRFNASEPQASNLNPPDGTKITQSKVNFSVDVSDPDFETSQGDEVQATLFVNGAEVGSETVTSNQTVTINHSLSEGSNVTYHWELADSYGDTTTTTEQTVTLPAELRIIDEENETLIDNASIRLAFYIDNGTETRVVETEISNGTVDFAALDLPADQPFVVTASADGYLSRRIYLRSLFDQQSIYLLSDSDEHRDVIFELQDFSGNYPDPETVLMIQRAINGSYRTVQSDFFGATGEFTAQLAYNERHRLVLLNTETGRMEQLGTFTALANSRSIVKVTDTGDIQVLKAAPIVTVSPSFETLPAIPETTISVSIVEQAEPIADWQVTATYLNNSTSTELANISSSTATSPAEMTVDLSNRSAGRLAVNASYTLETGTSGTISRTFEIREYARNEYSLLAIASGVTDLIPSADVDAFTTMLALLVTVFTTLGSAYAFPLPTEATGAIAVASLFAFGIIGWIGYGIPFVAGVTLLAASGLRRGI